MGFPLYIMLGHFALLIIFIFLTLCNVILKSPRISTVTNKLKKYLFWNGFIRLYMELYSGIALSSVLSLYSNINDKDSPFQWVRVSFYASTVSLIILALLPIFFVIFYCIRRDKWSEEAFRNMYGALLEGTKVTTQRGNLAILLVPTIFFYRRLIFISSIILLKDNIFVLILIQTCMVQLQLLVLHSLRIFESKAALWKQTLDECTYLLLIYVLMLFTDFVPDPEQRNLIGRVYIGITFTNIGVHFISLIR